MCSLGLREKVKIRLKKKVITFISFLCLFSSASLPATTANKRRTSSNINRSESVKEQSEKEKVSADVFD